jgi:hypothetical protein
MVTLNNPLQRGTNIMEKKANPDRHTQSFEFSPSYSSTFSLFDDQINNSGLLLGTYSGSEINMPSGWILSIAICSDGSDSSPGEMVTITFKYCPEDTITMILIHEYASQ